MLSLLYFILLIAALFRAVLGILKVLRTTAKLNRSRQELVDISGVGEARFVVLIPVLREQAIIVKTLKQFAAIPGIMKVVFITTQKEDFEEDELRNRLTHLKSRLLIANRTKFIDLTAGVFPSNYSGSLYERISTIKSTEERWQKILTAFEQKEHTRDILKRHIDKYNLEKIVEVIDYPETVGLMSHQLNYACRLIGNRFEDENTFFLIYNADSEVSDNLIVTLRKYLEVFPNARVIQQSSVFLSNYDTFEGQLSKPFLQAIALLQTRWTLVHELPRIFGQMKPGVSSYLECAHVVGHGLFIRHDALSEVGYFPTEYPNEDLALGYFLKAKGERIHYFPLLENSESPRSFSRVLDQYRTWFYAYISYPRYITFAFKKGDMPKLRMLLWGIRYIIRGIIFLSCSFVWFFLFLYPLFEKKYYWFLMTFVVFLLYGPLCFFVVVKSEGCHSLMILDKRLSLKFSLPTAIMSFPAYLTHSVGPIMAIVDTIASSFLGIGFKKRKTER